MSSRKFLRSSISPHLDAPPLEIGDTVQSTRIRTAEILMADATRGGKAEQDLLAEWENACMARAQESSLGHKQIKALLKQHILDNGSRFQRHAVEVDWALNPAHGLCQKLLRRPRIGKLVHGMR